jgi:hypothetical protein
MPVPRLQGLYFLRSVTPVLETAARACAGVDLVGKQACPRDARFSVRCSCAAHSCKIDNYVDNYVFYLIVKPPRPFLNIMLQ